MRKSVTVKLSLSYRSVYLNKEIIFDKLDKLLKKLGAEFFNRKQIDRRCCTGFIAYYDSTFNGSSLPTSAKMP